MRKAALSAALALALLPGRAASEDLGMASGNAGSSLQPAAYRAEPDQPVWRWPTYPYRPGAYDVWRSRPPVWYGSPRYPTTPGYGYRGYQGDTPYRGYGSYRSTPRYDRYGQQRALPQWRGNGIRSPNYRWADAARGPWPGSSDRYASRWRTDRDWRW